MYAEEAKCKVVLTCANNAKFFIRLHAEEIATEHAEEIATHKSSIRLRLAVPGKCQICKPHARKLLDAKPSSCMHSEKWHFSHVLHNWNTGHRVSHIRSISVNAQNTKFIS